MPDRAQIVADVLADQRLEGLDPGPDTRAVLDAWARGELSIDDLRRERAERRASSSSTRLRRRPEGRRRERGAGSSHRAR